VSAEVKQKQVNLSLSLRFEELFGSEMTEAMLKEFEDQNPNLRIKTTDAPPDILIFDEGEFNILASAGALSILDLFDDKESDSEEESAPQITNRLRIPLASFMDLLFYNINILSAAGFDRPPKTRDEFAAYAAAVSGSSGAALSLSAADRQALSRDVFSWIWAAGENPLSADNISSRAFIADLDFFGALNRNKAYAPRIFETTGDQRLEEFAEGKIAMMIASTRAIPFLREKMRDGAFGITTVPVSGGAGKYSVSLSGIYAGLSADCECSDEARSFLAFLAEKSPLFCAQLKAVPGIVSSLIPGDYVKDDPYFSKAWDIFESSVIIEELSGNPDAQEYESAFLEEFRIFFESGRTAQETAAAIVSRNTYP